MNICSGEELVPSNSSYSRVILLDEAYFGGHRYAVFAALIMSGRRFHIIHEELCKYLDSVRQITEIKWRKLKGEDVQIALRILKLALDEYAEGIQLNVVVVDTQGDLWQKWTENSIKDGVLKIYELYMKYGTVLTYSYFRPDADGISLDMIEELRYKINRLLGYPHYTKSNYVSRIKLVDSSRVPLMWVVDLVAGAIGAEWNRQHYYPKSPKYVVSSFLKNLFQINSFREIIQVEIRRGKKCGKRIRWLRITLINEKFNVPNGSKVICISNNLDKIKIHL